MLNVNSRRLTSSEMKSSPIGCAADGEKKVSVTMAAPRNDTGSVTSWPAKQLGVLLAVGVGLADGAGVGGGKRPSTRRKTWICVRPEAARKSRVSRLSAVYSESDEPMMQLAGCAPIVPSSAMGYASTRFEPRPAT